MTLPEKALDNLEKRDNESLGIEFKESRTQVVPVLAGEL